MRTPQEVTARRTPWPVRALAVVGAVALVVVAVGALWVLAASLTGSHGSPPDARPGVTPTGTTSPSGPTSTPPPADLGADETWLGDLDLDSGSIVAGGMEMRDVRAHAVGARARGDGTIRAARLDVDGIVPFSAVERSVGQGLRLAPTGDGSVRAQMPFDVFGHAVSVTVDARVVPDGRRIAVEPVRLVDAGPLGDALGRFPAIRQDVPGLPEGMTLTRIEVRPEGFAVHATGQDVTVRR